MGSPRQDDFDPYSPAEIYYGSYKKTDRTRDRLRTYSVDFERARNVSGWGDAGSLSRRSRVRRGSLDASRFESSKFLISVVSTLRRLELQEDTDGNFQITIEDTGPKVFSLGTYQLSNLLQELYLTQSYGRRMIILDHARLNENPASRLSRLVREHFWKELTRDMGETGIELAFRKDQGSLIYSPANAPDQRKFYTELSHRRPELGLTVVPMSKNITPEYVKSLADRPGLLALAIESTDNVSSPMDGIRFLPYVTSGRGHDKLHGWDTCFNVLGLLASDRVDLAKSSVEHICFCIRHYGHVPQVNRSYYLTRSSPPFLTDMAMRVYDKIKYEVNALEYHGLWVTALRYDPATKLSRYRTGGFGIPSDLQMELRETLEKYAAKYGISLEAFIEAYNSGSIEDPDLYIFLMHERAMQESGHSDSYRFRGSCANLIAINLNSLLYKYEKDIASMIRNLFGDRLEVPADMCTGSMPVAGYVDRSAVWERRARQRKLAIDNYLWNEENGMYFDYNIVNKEQSSYESATTFWPLWAGVASPSQAAKMMAQSLPRFETWGGIVASTEDSRGILDQDRQDDHWDYPYGWAPHQVMAWVGFYRYGYDADAQRLAYKLLSTIIRSFVDYNGIVEGCYDATRVIDPHRRTFGVNSADFQSVLRDGSAWVNASFVYGLQIMTSHQKRALGALVSWDDLARIELKHQLMSRVSTIPVYPLFSKLQRRLQVNRQPRRRAVRK
ncbi:neutral trehalase [Leptodontidium sp. 2 PMI_412]|nr:neutral trehalase [Leptodontidium sp. 2 PMI_412]